MKSVKANLGQMLVLVVAFIATTFTASAHIYYTGRDFGSLTASSVTSTNAILSNSVTGNYGWASGTDSNLGDSHKLTAFKFTLLNTGLVTFQVQGIAFKKGILNIGALATPGFSIYQGLAHLPPLQADHDFSAVSSAYNDATYGAGNWEGSFDALGNWKIGSDDGSTYADLSSFTYIGNAADGTSANYGSSPATTGYALDASNNVVSFANDTIHGDGLADGNLQASFLLGPGDYTIFVGGAQYFGSNNSGADASGSYGFNATLLVSAVPEPSTVNMLIGAIFILSVITIRRSLKISL